MRVEGGGEAGAPSRRGWVSGRHCLIPEVLDVGPIIDSGGRVRKNLTEGPFTPLAFRVSKRLLTIMGRAEPPRTMKCRLAPDRSLTPTLSQRARERTCCANFIVTVMGRAEPPRTRTCGLALDCSLTPTPFPRGRGSQPGGLGVSYCTGLPLRFQGCRFVLFRATKGRSATMARPFRLEFAGALYHVTARGNDLAARGGDC